MSVKPDRKRGLGRGLSALMADVSDAQLPGTGGAVIETSIPIEQVRPNPDQPRKTFEATDLEDLAASIMQKGIIQPLIVRKLGSSSYEIVAGERRWRAAQMAQLHSVPVIIREFSDTEVLEVAIIENIQRADLNAIEEAMSYRQLMDKFGHTQEKMAEALGKSRSHIANLLRLLNLPTSVREMVQKNAISAGHARTLISANNPEALAQKIIQGGLSVRATELLVKKQTHSKVGSTLAKSRLLEKDADTVALEGDLSASLGMKVTLAHRQGDEGGQLILNYKSLDQLDELCRKLAGF